MLEPLVLDLLVAFAERPGEVIPKRELRRRVWNDRHLDARTIAKRISELRSALGDGAGGEERYIATVPRQGYVLVAPVRRRSDRRRRARVVLSALALVLATVIGIEDRPRDRGPSSSELARRARAALDLRSDVDPDRAAVELLEQAVVTAPGDPRARVALTEAYALGALSRGSRAPWRRLALRSASALSSSTPASAPVERAVGLAASASFRIDDAIAAQTRALTADGRDSRARFRLAEAKAHRGDHAEAIALLRTNDSQDPGDARWAYELAYLYGQLGLDDLAGRWFRHAEIRAPLDVRGQIHRAVADLAAGRSSTIRERMARLLEADPACVPCLHLVAEVDVRTGVDPGTLELLRLVSEQAPEPEAAFARLRLATLSPARDAELERLATEWSGGPGPRDDSWFGPWLLARLEAARGHPDAALAEQAVAVDAGYIDWRTDASEPLFASLAVDPRFQRSLLRQRAAVRRQREAVIRAGRAEPPALAAPRRPQPAGHLAP